MIKPRSSCRAPYAETRTTDSQAHRLTCDSLLDALMYREIATIIPLGRFTYHPDSGYRGYATHVELHREGIRTWQHIFVDSVQHRHRTAAAVSGTVVTTESRTVEQREWHGATWRWVAFVLLLVVAAGFLTRRLFC
ncbi:hypothetical protein [Parapedobacter sp. 2B3]|uniref:hypothetical protein n=1 Tax=Parapedobacter sp. 2B3 TaxID=3342381 RepID=UPI0035B594D6